MTTMQEEVDELTDAVPSFKPLLPNLERMAARAGLRRIPSQDIIIVRAVAAVHKRSWSQNSWLLWHDSCAVKHLQHGFFSASGVCVGCDPIS
jgi:hypothetical protein